MGYCTIAQARAAGATGDDAAVQLAIDDATAAIDLYTADFFVPTAGTVVATVGTDRIATLPYTVRAVSSVSLVGSASPIESTAYSVHSSLTPGDFDGLVLYALGYNPLINGAEPWAGGYTGLFRSGQRLAVIGTFGFDAPPVAVRKACERLTFDATSDAQLERAGVKQLSVEGYSVEYTDATRIASKPFIDATSTGNYEVDRMLTPYCRGRVRVKGV